MVLIRIIVLQGLKHNVKINVKHVAGKLNQYSDWLSRMEYKKFWQNAKLNNRTFSKKPSPIPKELWPMEDIWLNNKYQHTKLKTNQLQNCRKKKN